VAQVGRFLVLDISDEYPAHSLGIIGIPPANNWPIAGDNNSNFQKNQNFKKIPPTHQQGGSSAIMEFFLLYGAVKRR
jgi:hypothetical protein